MLLLNKTRCTHSEIIKRKFPKIVSFFLKQQQSIEKRQKKSNQRCQTFRLEIAKLRFLQYAVCYLKFKIFFKKLNFPS
jgi:hypothetical protein